MDWRKWPPRRDTPGSVYIFRGDNGLHKIGSSVRVKKRIGEVARKSGIKCQLFYSVETDNMSELEYKLHRYFADKRVFGEWFDLSLLDISKAIAMMGSEKWDNYTP